MNEGLSKMQVYAVWSDEYMGIAMDDLDLLSALKKQNGLKYKAFSSVNMAREFLQMKLIIEASGKIWETHKLPVLSGDFKPGSFYPKTILQKKELPYLAVCIQEGKNNNEN